MKTSAAVEREASWKYKHKNDFHHHLISQAGHLVERCCIVDQADCADTQYSFQVFRNWSLKLLKAIEMGETKYVKDEVFLQAAQTHVSSVDVSEGTV